jgi:hypothetical protein
VELGGRRIAYAIDADGDRARSEDDVSDPSRPAILLAGESIAFGYGLTHDESVAAELGRDLHVPVVNLAVVGYGNDQAHLRVLAALARHRAPLAVVTVFVPEQIRRNVEPWRPRLALAPGGGLARGADGEPALVPAAGGPRVARLLGELPYHGDGPLDLTAAILRATADAARAHGAVPLFVVTNYRAACRHGEGEEPWVVDRLFVRQRLPFVRVDLGPDDRLPGWFEGHPNAAGARKIAAAVGRALREQLGARLAAARDGG